MGIMLGKERMGCTFYMRVCRKLGAVCRDLGSTLWRKVLFGGLKVGR